MLRLMNMLKHWKEYYDEKNRLWYVWDDDINTIVLFVLDDSVNTRKDEQRRIYTAVQILDR